MDVLYHIYPCHLHQGKTFKHDMNTGNNSFHPIIDLEVGISFSCNIPHLSIFSFRKYHNIYPQYKKYHFKIFFCSPLHPLPPPYFFLVGCHHPCTPQLPLYMCHFNTFLLNNFILSLDLLLKFHDFLPYRDHWVRRRHMLCKYHIWVPAVEFQFWGLN